MNDELKACPFCGGPADYLNGDFLHVRVKCQNCGIMTETSDRDHVTRIWNQRVQG